MEFLELYREACNGDWVTSGLAVQYRIEWDRNKATVYFQGSVEPEDWKLDFDFLVRPYKGCTWLAHHGFVSGYKSVRDEIVTQLSRASEVLVSGYSLGAAYAMLLHEDLRYTYPSMSVSTVAYGTPRVFWFPNKELRDRLDGILRINVRGDIVSHLPPWIFGFSHVGWSITVGPLSIPRVKKHFASEYEKRLGGITW